MMTGSSECDGDHTGQIQIFPGASCSAQPQPPVSQSVEITVLNPMTGK